LVALMRRTMHAAPGVGLAAPQIGLGVALAVVEDVGVDHPDVIEARERHPLAFQVLVNPRCEPVGDGRVGFYEGCLSVPGYAAVVHRARQVRLTCDDECSRPVDEVLIGWASWIVQHETDHLVGTLYLDQAESRSLAALAAWGGHWAAGLVPRAAAAELGFELVQVKDDQYDRWHWKQR
ncbi:MAG: peptide deformylase, partial [Micrococcales bacterium]|nr:peptide deformylase [Micrococcales bacterium]MCL2668542.1 peptide deformylase [Micrococcales bacterium]